MKMLKTLKKQTIPSILASWRIEAETLKKYILRCQTNIIRTTKVDLLEVGYDSKSLGVLLYKCCMIDPNREVISHACCNDSLYLQNYDMMDEIAGRFWLGFWTLFKHFL